MFCHDDKLDWAEILRKHLTERIPEPELQDFNPGFFILPMTYIELEEFKDELEDIINRTRLH